MASNPPFQVEDTNEDFFDKLVNDGDDDYTLVWRSLLDSMASWDHGSGGAPGVKEVWWTTFATEPAENDGNGFGSYNDFFTEFGDSYVDQIGKGCNLVSQKQNVVLSSNNVIDDSMHRKNVYDYSNQFQDV
ncbi:unnamed protein product [Lactuca saligna]|uniref:Uncharacterized protein n=1 Tax=Lactuca saligna TaxID=75948 RepID=A0AA35VEY1_LACSI|nr:unnamed protein product [Lactuca saligna]CAI9300125.1 unnamed protein product [Lactuca saligna]